ncbi:hypothetical protein CN495_26430 [Bacillus thuringiensis]|uniref:Uncharacterized protein n=1 Tax=Bacillus thuringiensis TaxID=1428 RepID=A0ABD6S0V3_BACTU|nr:hypothetical protein CN495_26430 [Bacillus thuringiensis]PGY71781.1 hypothetical protein COE44_24180 [Bacillus thuringiensis]
MFYRKGTQDGKGVACFTGRVRKMGKVLHVLQEGYARWERCCMFTGRVRKMGKVLHIIFNKYKKRRRKIRLLYLRPNNIC